jgi:hypothetical protein
MKKQTVFQDAREVRTKARKTFTSSFFPVGQEPVEIVADYIDMLTCELAFGPDDPMFPSGEARTGFLWPKACLGRLGVAQSPYDRFFARPSRPRACPMSIPIPFGKRSRSTQIRSTLRAKRRRPIHKTSAMKASGRLGRATEPCQSIDRQPSCGGWPSQGAVQCRMLKLRWWRPCLIE